MRLPRPSSPQLPPCFYSQIKISPEPLVCHTPLASWCKASSSMQRHSCASCCRWLKSGRCAALQTASRRDGLAVLAAPHCWNQVRECPHELAIHRPLLCPLLIARAAASTAAISSRRSRRSGRGRWGGVVGCGCASSSCRAAQQASGMACTRHCMIELRKHVLPRLTSRTSPPGAGRFMVLMRAGGGGGGTLHAGGGCTGGCAGGVGSSKAAREACTCVPALCSGVCNGLHPVVEAIDEEPRPYGPAA